MREGFVLVRLFCAAGAILLTSLSCAVFLAAGSSDASAATLQCRYAVPALDDNSMASRNR
jgi:hypothetical protein